MLGGALLDLVVPARRSLGLEARRSQAERLEHARPQGLLEGRSEHPLDRSRDKPEPRVAVGEELAGPDGQARGLAFGQPQERVVVVTHAVEWLRPFRCEPALMAE